LAQETVAGARAQSLCGTQRDDGRPVRTPRKNYYFVFYSERLDAMWIMSSEQFITEAARNKTGKNAGKHSIWFNGMKKNVEYPKGRYEQYRARDFSIFRQVTGLVVTPSSELANQSGGSDARRSGKVCSRTAKDSRSTSGLFQHSFVAHNLDRRNQMIRFYTFAQHGACAKGRISQNDQAVR
jgi:hypothetical protein